MTAQIALQRQTFFPGNVVSGSVQNCQSQNVQVMFTAEMYQHWTTETNDSFDSDDHHMTVTQHHEHTIPIKSLIIPVDVNSGRFQFQLDFGCVPSLDIEKCRISYYLKAIDNGVQSLPVPFLVLAPMQKTQWEADTSRSETREAQVMCCCCCERGKITNNFFISKSAIALDRDQPTIQVEILNNSSVDASSFHVVLNARGRTKIGHICEFVDQAGMAQVPARVKAGEKMLVEAKIPLKPLAAPSFSSAIVDIDYFITGQVVMDSNFTMSQYCALPVFVSHSVVPDSSVNFQEHWQNANNGFNFNAAPTMYQPPQNQAQLDTLPPDNFAQGPPFEFTNWGGQQQQQGGATTQQQGGATYARY